jgi:hypothetical protein
MSANTPLLRERRPLQPAGKEDKEAPYSEKDSYVTLILFPSH